MNNLKRIRRLLLVIIVSVLIIVPVYAAIRGTPVTMVANITTGQNPLVGSNYGTGLEPYQNTFYAAGRHWTFYIDSVSSFRYESFIADDTITIDNHLIEFGTGLYVPQFSIWYDKPTNTVHYARHEIAAPNHHVVYRMGTPNEDGTITWAAAEQVVANTPAELLTWRTNIAVDELGRPFVTWIDTDGIGGTTGIVYVEASSTTNGTWTAIPAVSNTFDTLNHHAWFVKLCPIGATGNMMELVWSLEDQTGGLHDGEVALMSTRWNTGTGWAANDTIAALGEMAAVTPHAFDLHDVGTLTWCVYTQAGTGDIYVRTRLDAQTWAASAAASMIFDGALVGFIPTLSGYVSNPPGEDLLLILNDSTLELRYSIHTNGDAVNVWSPLVDIWAVNTPLTEIITRHNAVYTYGSPVGFIWQVLYDDGVNPEYDNVYYWWFDNEELGYYLPPTTPLRTANNMLEAILPIIIAVIVVIIVFKKATESDNPIWSDIIVSVFGGVTAYFLTTVLLSII